MVAKAVKDVNETWLKRIVWNSSPP